ncbi:hypothetical protein ACWGNM_31625 [Streptomyces sp. NPDC055796]
MADANDPLAGVGIRETQDSTCTGVEMFRTAQVTAVQGGQDSAQETDLGRIPADQVKPEDIGTLSLRYVDGQPQLVVSGGTVIPAGLTVVDGAGNAVAAYAAQQPAQNRLAGGVLLVHETLDQVAEPR